MSFSEKLQKLRKEHKLSQEQLADMLDVTRQSVSKWESGTTYPEMDKLITMCKIFKCSLDDLTNDEITEIKVEPKKNNQFNNVIDSVLEIIEKTVKMFKVMTFGQTVKCLFSLLFLGLFLLIFRIPFEMLSNGFYEIISSIGRPAIESFLYGIFTFVLDIIYFVLYVLLFVYIYKLSYLDKYEFIKDEKKKADTEKIVVEDKKEITREKEIKYITKEQSSNNAIFSILGKIILGFIKFLVICFTIPVLFIIFCLFILLAIVIYLLFKDIIYIGAILGVIFSIIMSLVILEIAIEFIFNKPAAFKRLLWTFIISLGGIGISCGIFALEISETEYINTLPPNVKMDIITKEYTMNSDTSISNDIEYYNGYYHYSYYTKVQYIIDETLIDTVKLEAVYDPKYMEVAFIKNDEMIGIDDMQKSDPELLKHILYLVFENLKDKKIYDYYEIKYVTLNVYANSKNIDVLKQNADSIEKRELEEFRQEELNQKEDYYNSKITEYENQIFEFENDISEYKNRITELESENKNLEIKLKEYKDKINEIIAE